MAHCGNTEDATSVVTFQCVLQVMENIVVKTFLLENVDLEESKTNNETNFDVIVKCLENAGGGYWLMVYKILTTDFGLPQRRVRLFFLGVSKKHYPEFVMSNVTTHLEHFKLKVQHPDFWLNFSSVCMYISFNLLAAFVQLFPFLFQDYSSADRQR